MDFGGRLAKLLRPGDIVCLSGELGSGKTTLVKGIAQALKINPAKVNSPTFVIMNIYESKIPLYHFDLYRLDGKNEISLTGYDEFLYGQGIAVIEWAERFQELFPKECLKIDLKHEGETKRSFQLLAQGKRYETLMKRL